MKKRFTATVAPTGKSIVVRVPFDPDDTWGKKPKHHVTGTIGGAKMRAVLERRSAGWEFRLGPMWMRDCGVKIGEKVFRWIDATKKRPEVRAERVAETVKLLKAGI